MFAFAWATQFAYAKVSGRSIQYTRLAACGLLEISGNADDCADASGGIVKSYVADIKDLDIEGATFDLKGRLVDIPWLTVATPYVALTPDDNNQAFFNQEGARDDNDKFTATGTASYTFTGVNEAKVYAIRKLTSCCALVVVHEWGNGFTTVQGVKAVKVANVWTLKRTKKAAKAIPSILSDTGENSDRIGLTIVNSDSEFAVTLTPGQIAPDPVIAASTISTLVVTD
jgi:hypothetical protein